MEAKRAEEGATETVPANEAVTESVRANEVEIAAASAAELLKARVGGELDALAEGVRGVSVGEDLEVKKGKEEDWKGQKSEGLTKQEMVEEALSCPCIAAMKDGPCGGNFMAAYRCFLESEAEPKGMDCLKQFSSMQKCMADNPKDYNVDDDGEDPFAVSNKPSMEALSNKPPAATAAEPIIRDASAN